MYKARHRWPLLAIPALGKWSLDDPWGSLARECSPFGELQADEKPCPPNSHSTWRMTQAYCLTLKCMFIHMQACSHIHEHSMCTHKNMQPSNGAVTLHRTSFCSYHLPTEVYMSLLKVTGGKGFASLTCLNPVQGQEGRHFLKVILGW